MAFDGVVLAGIKKEIKDDIVGGRIYKIYQPEKDEICLVVKNKNEEGSFTRRLVISVDASLPLIYISDKSKENPLTAPNFCMLLRKHIGNGRIMAVEQPNMERIIELTIEHLDELGCLRSKRLIVELMGKYSNIIFTDEDYTIIDSIKHVSYQISSVREVLPGRKYVLPPDQDKKNPLETDVNYFMNHVMKKPSGVAKAICSSYTGISYQLAQEMVYRAGIDGDASTAACDMQSLERIYEAFEQVMSSVKNENPSPCIAYAGYEPKEFAAVRLTMYETEEGVFDEPAEGRSGIVMYTSVSQLLDVYYSQKAVMSRMKQKSTDLRKIVSNAIERTSKKYDLQIVQLKDTEKREKYRVYGELITAYGYSAQKGDSELVCENYYTGEEIRIPLDTELTPIENGKRYFARYNKLKRTYEALSELTVETGAELDYLLSVQNSLEIVNSEADLTQIKQELMESGYIRGRADRLKGKQSVKAKLLHYISSDGYHMYVGKNNIQNEEITFKLAEGSDMWFHAKNVPGSHVIVKTNKETLPDRTYEEAAGLAAYYSQARSNPKVDIDYTERRNLKKPPKAKPGYVIYHTNYSMTIKPDIHGLRQE